MIQLIEFLLLQFRLFHQLDVLMHLQHDLNNCLKQEFEQFFQLQQQMNLLELLNLAIVKKVSTLRQCKRYSVDVFRFRPSFYTDPDVRVSNSSGSYLKTLRLRTPILYSSFAIWLLAFGKPPFLSEQKKAM